MRLAVARPSRGSGCGLMPVEDVQLALPWSIFRAGADVRDNWIPPDVQPLLAITLAGAELAVEKIFLPDRLFIAARPVTSCSCPPEFHPAFQRCPCVRLALSPSRG